MVLADFIRENTESIAAEWEKFASSLLPNEEFSVSVLRNGINDILLQIANDMDEIQSERQQQIKSEGHKEYLSDEDTAAEHHAIERLKMGLTSQQIIAEFRALRASIIRLWEESEVTHDKAAFTNLIRFNEAVDTALTETEARYSKEIDKSRELFLGILGHDLRNPLAAISGSAELLSRSTSLDRNPLFAKQILASSGRMSHMITDLLELTRVKLGKGILIKPTKTNMRSICLSVLDEMRAIHPHRYFKLEPGPDIEGEWDIPRITQVLSNLIGNAVQHGAADSPVTLKASIEEEGARLCVHNEGPIIPSEKMKKLFDYLVQGTPNRTNDEDQSTSLGLGLYIAKEIVLAHGGSIKAQSSEEEGTKFIANLPIR